MKTSKKDTSSSNFNLFLIKFFIIILVVTLLTLVNQRDIRIKNTIYNKVYNSNFSFTYFKSIYNKYVGNVIPFQNIFKKEKVFKEKLTYNSLSKYNKGVKLTLDDNYPIPIIKGGIVTFVGTKNKMNTVIIKGSDDIDIWYLNLSNTNMKLYDYVEDNSIVGEAKNNELYMLFYKDGVEIDYKEVLK